MEAGVGKSVLEQILNPLGECLTPEVAEKILNIHITQTDQARINVLAEKANEGLLTDKEHAEYGEYVNALDFLAILHAQARHTLGIKLGE